MVAPKAGRIGMKQAMVCSFLNNCGDSYPQVPSTPKMGTLPRSLLLLLCLQQNGTMSGPNHCQRESNRLLRLLVAEQNHERKRCVVMEGLAVEMTLPESYYVITVARLGGSQLSFLQRSAFVEAAKLILSANRRLGRHCSE